MAAYIDFAVINRQPELIKISFVLYNISYNNVTSEDTSRNVTLTVIVCLTNHFCPYKYNIMQTLMSCVCNLKMCEAHSHH